MKKILSLSLLLIAGSLSFTSCQSEEDDLFDSSAAERLAASKVTYAKLLPQATAGWVMEYYPTNGGSWPRGNGYLLLAKFNDDKSVDMASLNEEMTDGKYMEDTSLWEVIADQGPVLSFNTYNQCLHSFADPALYETGLGLEGDYEFEIINLQEGAQFAMLKGKKRGTYTRMTRLEEGTDFKEYLTDVLGLRDKLFKTSVPNHLLINFGENRYVINSVTNGFLSFYPEGGDEISETESHPFLITKRDGNYFLRFRDAFEREDMEGTLQEMRYDSIQDKFIGLENELFSIEGPDASEFFKKNLTNGKGWQFTPNDEITGNLATIIKTISDDFSSKKYTFTNIKFIKSGEDLTVVLSLKSGKSSVDLIYLYTIDESSNNLKITYREPYETKSNKRASQILETIPSLINLLEALSGEYQAATNTSTNFDLSSVLVTFPDGSTAPMTFTNK